MTEAQRIAQVRIFLDSENQADDAMLAAYLNVAGSKILDRAYPFDAAATEVPPRYELLQCEIAAHLYNKRGAEGEVSHSENGISRSYETADIPKALLAQITPAVGVPS